MGYATSDLKSNHQQLAPSVGIDNFLYRNCTIKIEPNERYFNLPFLTQPLEGHNIAEIALWLEAPVGNLEDDVLCAINGPPRSLFSTKVLKSLIATNSK